MSCCTSLGRRIVAVLLAAVLAGSVLGCTSSSSPPTTPKTSNGKPLSSPAVKEPRPDTGP
jgi:hypothetical protein